MVVAVRCCSCQCRPASGVLTRVRPLCCWRRGALCFAGSGKTHLVRALAAEARLPLVVLNGGEAVGEDAEQKLRRAFSAGAASGRAGQGSAAVLDASRQRPG